MAKKKTEEVTETPAADAPETMNHPAIGTAFDLAEEVGVNIEDIPGTGPEGEVTEADVTAFLVQEGYMDAPEDQPEEIVTVQISSPTVSPGFVVVVDGVGVTISARYPTKVTGPVLDAVLSKAKALGLTPDDLIIQEIEPAPAKEEPISSGDVSAQKILNRF